MRSLGAALVLAAASWAGAQCGIAPGSDFDNFTLEGFGSVYFREIRFDQVEDLAEFYDGVCIAGLDWTLLTERVLLTGLSGELRLTADAPDLRVPGLALRGVSLEATESSMTMTDATLDGGALRGAAAAVSLDLITNVLSLDAPTLLGDTLMVSGERAILDGDELTIWNATATTCVCGGPPLYTVDGSVVVVDLVAERVALAEGRLRIGPLAVPLGESLTLTPDDLADLEPPFTVSYQGASGGDPGAGLGLAVPSLPVAAGLALTLDLAGLDPGRPLSGTVLLRGSSAGASFSFGVQDGGVESETILAQRLLPWLRAELAVRHRDREDEDRLHEGALRLVGEASLALPSPLGRFDAEAALLAAASSQAATDPPTSSARLGAEAAVRWTTPRTVVGRGRLAVRTSATGYPTLGASQATFAVEQSWRATLGPVALDVGYRRVWSDAGSPFSVRLDRVLPESVASATLALELPLAGADVAASLRSEFDLAAAAWTEAGVALAVGVPLGPSGALAITADADLLGLFVAGEPTAGAAGVAWRKALPVGEAEFGVEVGAEVVAGVAGLTWIDLSAAYPLLGEGATVTPYLAIDVLPLLSGGAPGLAGYGLDLAWRTCCGTLLLGYRSDRDGVDLGVGVRLAADGSSGTIAFVEPPPP